MKVIIAGTRSLTWYLLSDLEEDIRDSGFKVEEVVSGHAKGIDQLGELWAERHKAPVKLFIPEWRVYGRRAGILRNHKMGDYADALIAIWDGKSRGTRDMIDYMRYLGKMVYVVGV